MSAVAPEALGRLREVLDPVDDSVVELPSFDGVPGLPEMDRRAAAVLAPLFVASGEVHVVLTRKSDRLRQHSGQVSFPGGGWEPGDASLLATALREAQEEIGLDPADVDVLGALSPMPTATTGYAILPFVGVVPAAYTYVPDGFEVDRVFTAPLGLFADPARRRTETWQRGGVSHPVHFFDDVDGELVWGATARMLVALLDRLAGVTDRRPIIG